MTQDILPYENMAERQERSRLSSYIKAQAKEIESLRSEITILKRKDIPPIVLSLPAQPQLPPSSEVEDLEQVQLPPIHDSKP